MKKVWIAPIETQTGICTEKLQKMIDACAEAGGGQVRLQAGRYVTGTLYLKSGVELFLDAGAVLAGSDDCRDYSNLCPVPSMVENVPQWYNALVTAVDAENIAISGEGIIDGVDCLDRNGEQGFRGPHAVFFFNCENVCVQGATIVRAACYSLMFERCRKILVRNVSVRGGQDAIRLGACSDVLISGCDFRSGDDCIGGSGNANVRVYDTALNTPGGSALLFSSAGLHVKNCVFWSQGVYPAVFKDDKRYSNCGTAVCAGLDYGYPRGETSDQWLFEDVEFENVEALFRFNSNFYGRVPIHVKNVVFERIHAVNLIKPVTILSDVPCPIRLTIRDSVLACAKGDSECEGLFVDGENFESLCLENTVLKGFSDEPFKLRNVGETTLTNVKTEAASTDTATRNSRFVMEQTTSLYLPVGADEHFRGAMPYIPKPTRNQ